MDILDRERVKVISVYSNQGLCGDQSTSKGLGCKSVPYECVEIQNFSSSVQFDSRRRARR